MLLKLRILFFCASAALFFSCEENTDLSEVSSDYIYSGSFAIPVGSSALTLEKMGVGLPKNWLLFPALLDSLKVIQLLDSVNFNLNNLVDSVAYIHSIDLNLNVSNKFPTSGYFTLIFIDTLGNVTDTLINKSKGLFEAATFDGDSTIAEKTIHKLFFDSAEISDWGAVNRLVIDGVLFNTLPDNALYKNYSKHSLTIEISAIIRFKYNLNKLGNE